MKKIPALIAVALFGSAVGILLFFAVCELLIQGTGEGGFRYEGF